MLAKVQRDLTFECPTVDEEASGDVEPGIPMIVLNADELGFLVGESVMLIGGETRMVVRSKRAR
jgi:hypothetical protein